MTAILVTLTAVVSFALGWCMAMYVRTIDARRATPVLLTVAEPSDRIEGAAAILERARRSGNVSEYLAARSRTPLIVARYETWRNRHARLRRTRR